VGFNQRRRFFPDHHFLVLVQRLLLGNKILVPDAEGIASGIDRRGTVSDKHEAVVLKATKIPANRDLGHTGLVRQVGDALHPAGRKDPYDFIHSLLLFVHNETPSPSSADRF
jgi:hypothetical protein